MDNSDFPTEQQAQQPSKTSSPLTRRAGSIFIGCLAAIFLIWIVSMMVLAAIGLVTGYLYLLPARGSGEVELHGTWARIVSAIILLFFATVGFLIYRNSIKRRRPKILED
ncbi:MAG TPA: hypothetical protein VEV84_05175 [Pyrinomonadaceae bacterium]|nr:hypothetical protein [Pyrinomonadaceae bacterium]